MSKWECFRDSAYYDMWCVRPVGERLFENGWHVASEGEAKALCEFMEQLQSSHQEQLESSTRAFKELAQQFIDERQQESDVRYAQVHGSDAFLEMSRKRAASKSVKKMEGLG